MVNNHLLLVFCKNPSLGKVKTRLAKTVGNENALKIYKALLAKTADILATIDADIHVYYDQQIEQNDLFSSVATLKKSQSGNDLGERMANAFQESFVNYAKVAIIGTDLWTLEAQDIITTFKTLETTNAVIGPSSDGGYYLLGLNHFLPQLFQNKDWGTSSVLSSTLKDLKEVDFRLLKEKNDVDTFEDLQQNPTLNAIIQ